MESSNSARYRFLIRLPFWCTNSGPDIQEQWMAFAGRQAGEQDESVRDRILRETFFHLAITYNFNALSNFSRLSFHLSRRVSISVHFVIIKRIFIRVNSYFNERKKKSRIWTEICLTYLAL